jgi:hypothetical protein
MQKIVLSVRLAEPDAASYIYGIIRNSNKTNKEFTWRMQ